MQTQNKGHTNKGNIRKKRQGSAAKKKHTPQRNRKGEGAKEEEETRKNLNKTLITKLLHCSCLAVEGEGENGFSECRMNINIDGLIKVNLRFSREKSKTTSLAFKAEIHMEEGHKSLHSLCTMVVQ